MGRLTSWQICKNSFQPPREASVPQINSFCSPHSARESPRFRDVSMENLRWMMNDDNDEEECNSVVRVNLPSSSVRDIWGWN